MKTIYRSIRHYKAHYCCHVLSIYRLFICWKNLKEVKENYDSVFIRDSIKESKNFNCEEHWFHSRRERLKFLKECLSKFK